MIKIVKDKNQVQAGKIFYEVMAFLGESDGYITKITVIGDKFDHQYSNHKSTFFPYDFVSIIDTNTERLHNRIKTEGSLNDRNIPVNAYNMHCLCEDEESAIKYLNLVQDNNVTELVKLDILSYDKLKHLQQIEEDKEIFDFGWYYD